MVVAGDAKAAAGQLPAEIVAPPDVLEAHAHHEQDERIAGRAELFDAELDPARHLDDHFSHVVIQASEPLVWFTDMANLKVGDPAPDFTLEGTEGTFTLSEHRGERVVLLFYPGDDTTVCTKQFCAYRDAADEMTELDAKVVGISTQGMESKQDFKSKHGLTTELLADPDAEVATLYGVYAKRFDMAKRTVFIIDAEGKIAHKHGNFMSLSFDSADDLKKALAKV